MLEGGIVHFNPNELIHSSLREKIFSELYSQKYQKNNKTNDKKKKEIQNTSTDCLMFSQPISAVETHLTSPHRTINAAF